MSIAEDPSSSRKSPSADYPLRFSYEKRKKEANTYNTRWSSIIETWNLQKINYRHSIVVESRTHILAY